MSLPDEPELSFTDAHRVVIAVRYDDLDTNGHVRGPAYLAYADHARWAAVADAGIDLADLRDRNIGPVNLETTLRFRHELRPHDEVEVRTVFQRGTGKISRVLQELRRSDGVLVAEVTSVSGMLDLVQRRLLPDPDKYWRNLASDPAMLGLT
ncbi:acyl-CoA thioesterase [Pseudonocardia spinosispora]|uniref:acyl-CoA thioesterase n=1 Tax=Pseudonocardia spinosispora TaxID=103441 RepID=UPI0004122216|nr:acyl-CoA thioesterase [Pseudonocardia spinosispora]